MLHADMHYSGIRVSLRAVCKSTASLNQSSGPTLIPLRFLRKILPADFTSFRDSTLLYHRRRIYQGGKHDFGVAFPVEFVEINLVGKFI